MTFRFFARYLLAFILAPIFSNSHVAAGEQTWIVISKGAGLVYEKQNTQSMAKTVIPYAQSFKGQASRGWIKIEGNGVQGFIKGSNVTQCASKPMNSYAKRSLQKCLNYLGYQAGNVDGAIGGSTKTAITKFEQKNSIAVNSMSLSCAAALICTTYRQATQARIDRRKAKNEIQQKEKAAKRAFAKRQKEARTLFLDRNCNDLRQFDAVELGPNTVLKCVNLKESEKTDNAFAALLNHGKCEEADVFAGQHQLQGDKVKMCFSERVNKTLATYLANGSCNKAQTISQQTGLRKADIEKCFVERARKKTQSQLDFAMLKNECAIVKNLEKKLNKADGFEKCLFNTAFNLKSARRMFLAAIRYDAANKRTKARLLYEEIMTRFEEDDLAIQAALRLVALNDLAISEQARVAAKKELARLKKTASEAKVAAERAGQDAQRARQRAKQAEIQAAQQVTRQAKTRNNRCSHVYKGKYFRITQQKSKTAKSILGTIFSATVMGNHFHVMGVNPQAGVATACSTDSGKCFEFACTNIPR